MPGSSRGSGFLGAGAVGPGMQAFFAPGTVHASAPRTIVSVASVSASFRCCASHAGPARITSPPAARRETKVLVVSAFRPVVAQIRLYTEYSGTEDSRGRRSSQFWKADPHVSALPASSGKRAVELLAATTSSPACMEVAVGWTPAANA